MHGFDTCIAVESVTRGNAELRIGTVWNMRATLVVIDVNVCGPTEPYAALHSYT